MNEITKADYITEKPMVIPPEAYLSAEYAKAEGEKLWPKVWQAACREEELREVGDYVTYDIHEETIIVVRSSPDTISAYYNVCQHRGRRLTEGCGNTRQFTCRFHGWCWNLEGENTYALDLDDWGGKLTVDELKLPEVRVGLWGGWVWINMDPDAEPLEQYLEPATTMLAPFQLEKMRYKWRRWLIMQCNWKTALEAFNESYHVQTSHPQLRQWMDAKFWSRSDGGHGWHGVIVEADGGSTGLGGVHSRDSVDPRIAAAELQDELKRTLDTTTTDTLVAVAQRLVDELPEGTPAGEVAMHMMAKAVELDAARGVEWPQMTMEQAHDAGADWHLFPNLVVLPGPTFALVYRARPNGKDPDSCRFEVCALERFPEGEEPVTEWDHRPEMTEESWGLILKQDFSNMPEVQKGMKSRGFKGARPNPREEVAVLNFHRTLAKYMGAGAPKEL